MNNRKNLNQDESKTREEEWHSFFMLVGSLKAMLIPVDKILHDIQNQASYLKMDEKAKKRKSK